MASAVIVTVSGANGPELRRISDVDIPTDLNAVTLTRLHADVVEMMTKAGEDFPSAKPTKMIIEMQQPKYASYIRMDKMRITAPTVYGDLTLKLPCKEPVAAEAESVASPSVMFMMIGGWQSL